MILDFKILNIKHFDEAQLLFEEVTKSLIQAGLDQWDDVYPTNAHILEDINNGHAFGGFIGDNLVGYVALNEWADPTYDAIDWHFVAPAIIVHRLAIHPAHQGKGIGKQMMNGVQNFATESRYSSIRLDAFIPNFASNKLYIGLSYRNAGTVLLRKGHFYCYEKSL